MAGMKWHTWMLVAGLAVFATIACLPGMRWMVRDQVGMAFGKKDLIRSFTYLRRSPELLGLSASDAGGADRQKAVAWALLGPDWEDRAKRLEPLAQRYPDDAFVQAALARYCLDLALCSKPGVIELPQKPLTHLQTWALATALEACRRGERAAPDNAFFPLVAASCRLDLGDTPNALMAVDRATLASLYSDYSADEDDLLARLMRARNYCGEFAVEILCSDTQCLEYANFHGLAARLPGLVHGKESLRIRMKLLKILDTVGRGSEQAFGIIVSHRSARALVREPGAKVPIPNAGTQNDRGLKERQDCEDLELAAGLQRKAQSAGVAEQGIDAPSIIHTLESNRDACFWWFRKSEVVDFPPVPGIDISVSLLWGLLVGLAACSLVVAGQWLKALNDWWAELLPFVPPAALCVGLGLAGAWLAMTLMLALLAVAPIMIHRPNTRRAGMWVLGVGSLLSAAVLAIPAVVAHTFDLLPAALLAVFLPLSMIRYRGNVGYVATLLLVLLVTAESAAQIVGNLMPPMPSDLGLSAPPPAPSPLDFAVLLPILGLAFVLAPRAKVSLSTLVGPFALMTALAYGLSSGYEIRWNERLKPVVAEMARQGQIIREHARQRAGSFVPRP